MKGFLGLPRRLPLALGLLLGTGLVAAPSRSDACYNEVIRRLTPVESIASAEKDLDELRLGEAASRVRGVYPNIRDLGADAPPLALRAQRIFALVLVRADGMMDSGRGWARWGNLEWAVETLSALEKQRPNDPRAQADLAEARTRFARSRDTGIKVLEDLDGRDLLGSPYAYLALARARRAAGDDRGAGAALLRCGMMSNDKRRCAMTDFSGESTRG